MNDVYSTDHKQLNAHLRVTREGGTSARERSMKHSRAAYECARAMSTSMNRRARERSALTSSVQVQVPCM